LWKASAASHSHPCGISVHHSTRTAPFIRSLVKRNVLPCGRTTTRLRHGSTSWMHCSLGPQPRSRMLHSLLRCCRSRTMDAIPCSTWHRNSADKELCKLLSRNLRLLHVKVPC